MSRRFSVAEIANALPKDAVLWEFVKYRPYAFEGKGKIGDRYGTDRYLAFILDHRGSIEIIDIGDAVQIDSMVTEVRNIVNSSSARIYSAMAADYEGQIKEITAELHELIFAPLAAKFHQSSTIYVSPDGDLHLLPFEILVDPENRYVIESHRLCYLSSGRDLLRFDKKSGHDGDVLLIADPDFDDVHLPAQTAAEPGVSETPPVSMVLFESMRGSSVDCLDKPFTRLQYGRTESTALAGLFHSQNEVTVNEYHDRDAREEVLKQLTTAPYVLHIITHGFFCRPPKEQERDMLTHPLLRSGLALAGANHVIQGNDIDETESDDGILSAYEVSDLRLMGTSLVTLSACETGLGVPLTSEGIIGLQRAFRHAGADAVLMSLWKIPDKETVILMEKFYRNWLNGKSKQNALREATLEILKTCRAERGHGHPVLWAGFVLTGNPK
jgi:CHAT domain-containing protein